MKIQTFALLAINLFLSSIVAESASDSRSEDNPNPNSDVHPRSPTCAPTDQTALKRRVGYYQGWAATRKCMEFLPEQIPAGSLTHVNFASAVIDSNFKIAQMSDGDVDLWTRTVSLKNDNPGLKVYLSVGGWGFNNPRTSNLVGSFANTLTFINSITSVLLTYGFDGIDLDWNYPGAPDRGGIAADRANYANFLSLLQPALSDRGYGLTFTAPINPYYLQYFDLPKMLLHADWLNLAAYDLHGYYDGAGSSNDANIRAHANLTDINNALQTILSQGINSSQIVLGMAFYGRSFTLANVDCTSAGECLFASGGDGGECSTSPGTLMFSEIQDILASDENWANLDLDAAVATVVFEDNQWVSVETADSFATKITLANTLCLGGSMIWSVDQDDTSYSAIQALYSPAPAISTPAIPSFGQCYTTGCGVPGCNPGYRASITYYSPTDGICAQNNPANVCCPRPYLPAECRKGGYTNQITPCNPQCNSNELMVGKDVFGPTTSDFCISGTAGICCTVDAPFPPECTINSPNWSCPYPLPYSNCGWHGTPPLCDDAACPAGQISLLTDLLGDGQRPCSGGGGRVFCCDPAVTDKIPLVDVFPNTNISSTEAAYVELSNDIGTTASLISSNSSYPNGNQIDHPAAFGEVVISSPKASSVSSMATTSNWVIINCDPHSDQEQTVLVYCSKPNDPSCAHVHIGGAENTIIELPQSCGAGPYARIISLQLQSNHSVLPSSHLAIKPANESVYLLHFDYDFTAVPLENGPIYMRIDSSDMPSYWDNIVASAPSRKRQILDHTLDKPVVKRWFGGFPDWFAKINTITTNLPYTRSFNWHDTIPIFHDTRECAGLPQFKSTLDINLSGQARLNTKYGLYIEGTVVPPEITAAYLYFSSDARASLSVTIEGQADVTYNSEPIVLGTYGFPGLYVPGLAAIGPTLKLTGYINGQISVAGSLTTGITYDFPSVSFALGKSTDQVGPAATAPSVSSGYGYDFSYEMELDGDISIHLVPSIQLGIQLLDGKLIDAQAYVQADISAGIGFNGSVSNSVSPEICVIPHYGVQLSGGLIGNVLYWEPGSTNWPFYTSNTVVGDKCWSSITEPSLSGSSQSKRYSQPLHIQYQDGSLPDFALLNSTNSPAYLQSSPTTSIQPTSQLESRTGKRKCPGWMNCPSVGEQVGGVRWDNDIWRELDLEQPEYVDDNIGAAPGDLLPRDFEILGGNLTKRLSLPTPMVTSQKGGISFGPWPYSGTDGNFYYLARPTDLTSDNVPDPGVLIENPGESYAKEHVYEMQLMTQFIDFLFTNQPLIYGSGPGPDQKEFKSFVTTYIKGITNFPVPPNRMMRTNENLIDQLRRCVPSDHQSVLDTMPTLEGNQNRLKAAAFGNKAFRTKAKFTQHDYSKKVFVLRSILGMAQYLAQNDVQAQFISGSNCIKAVWKTWHTAYIASKPPAASKPDNKPLEDVYTEWIKDKVQTTLNNIQDGATTLMGYLTDEVTADNSIIKPPNVAIGDVPFSIIVDTDRDQLLRGARGVLTQVTLNQIRANTVTKINNLNYGALLLVL